MAIIGSLGTALVLILAVSFLAWIVSLAKSDVSFVDSLWSLFFLLAGVSYAWQAPAMGTAAWLVVALLAAWSLRLAVHITVRNWGEGEDSRYQQIRKNNEPRFALKSLYMVFGLQGMLAFVISIPLLFAINTDAGIGPLQLVATALWLLGFAFEAGGAWWTVFSPLLMTVLLVKVSGVALLEKTIGDRRPGYADYVRRTSAFIPWPPRSTSGGKVADDHAW